MKIKVGKIMPRKINMTIVFIISAAIICFPLYILGFGVIAGTLVTIGCILGLILVLFIVIQAYAYCGIWLSGIKLRKMLKKQNRLISLEQAKENIRNNKGKIIVDAPTLGWNVSRVWLSSRVDFAPRPESWDKKMLCPQEDIDNHSKFIDQVTGTARLIDAFVISQRVKSYLKKHFGNDDCGFIFTGGVLYQQEITKRKSIQ